MENNILAEVDAAFEDVHNKQTKKLKAFFKISNNFEWLKENLQEAVRNNDDEHMIRIRDRIKETTQKIIDFGSTYQEDEEKNETSDKMPPPEVPPSGRKHRKAFEEATNRVTKQISEKLNTKMRNKNSTVVTIKKEIMDMPPPTTRPKRGPKKKVVQRNASLEILPESPETIHDVPDDSGSSIDKENSLKRSKRTKRRNGKNTEENNEEDASNINSQVTSSSMPEDVVERTPLRAIVKMEKLSAQFISEQLNKNNEEIINKTPVQAAKRSKRTKAKKNDDKQVIVQVNNNLNITNVIVKKSAKSPEHPANVTMTIAANPLASSTFVSAKGMDDLMTDDESVEIPETKKTVVTNSAVKKKVQDFEKLAQEGKSHQTPKKAIPRLVRSPKETSNNKQIVGEIKTVKDATLSVVKPKEEDARKKKEAMISAQTEERKRKREEKELKAKLQREAIEREIQRNNEERLKKREELTRRREELKKMEETKKLQAVEEARKRELKLRQKMEEDRKILDEKLRIKELNEKRERELKKNPTYMEVEAPPLPTSDNLDSDDENYVKPVVPDWKRSFNLLPELKFQERHKTGSLLFKRKIDTPDLREIFPNIHPKKLVRRSSAVWKQPARCAMMDSILEDDNEL